LKFLRTDISAIEIGCAGRNGTHGKPVLRRYAKRYKSFSGKLFKYETPFSKGA